jgi:hypothetical protein
MTIPRETSASAWHEQVAALERLGPAGRVEVAVDMSEAVRAIQLDGIRARHPAWSRRDVIRHWVKLAHRIDLPGNR